MQCHSWQGRDPPARTHATTPSEGSGQARGGSPEPRSSGKFLVMRQVQGPAKKSAKTGIRRAHGQAKQGCGGDRAWHPTLLGQGLTALGWAERMVLGSRAGMGLTPGEAGKGHSGH